MRKKIVMLLLAAAMVTGSVATVNTETQAAVTNVAGGSWHQNSYGWWYQLRNGSYVQDDFAEIGGETYYFDQDGYMQTGWVVLGNDWYFFEENGAMAKGWKRLRHYWYYFEADGRNVTGMKMIDGYWYYFGAYGEMHTGWKYIDGEWYYFEPGGWAPKGWKWIDGNCYYFYKDGHMASDELIDGEYVNEAGQWTYEHWVYDDNAGAYWYMWENGTYPKNCIAQIDYTLYYFDTSGYMRTGWQYIEDDVDLYMGEGWYYFESSGKMHFGWLQEGAAWYYLPVQEPMPTDRIVEIDGWCYYFAASGKMQTGWQYLYDEWYYFEPGGWAPKGWKWINGNCYYFYEDGRMAYDEITPDGYYVDENGIW